MNIYYVYAYISHRTGLPYYIGKGKDYRAYEKHGRTPVPEDRSRIVFLECNLTELGAFAIERRMIQWYGRRDLGTGILLNRTDGGEGTTNLSNKARQKISESNKTRVITEESNQKRREAMTGKILPTRGIKRGPMSAETKHKLSLIKKGRPGRKKTDEEKQKISIAMREIAKRRPPISEDTRRKLCESQQRRRAKSS